MRLTFHIASQVECKARCRPASGFCFIRRANPAGRSPTGLLRRENSLEYCRTIWQAKARPFLCCGGFYRLSAEVGVFPIEFQRKTSAKLSSDFPKTSVAEAFLGNRRASFSHILSRRLRCQILAAPPHRLEFFPVPEKNLSDKSPKTSNRRYNFLHSSLFFQKKVSYAIDIKGDYPPPKRI